MLVLTLKKHSQSLAVLSLKATRPKKRNGKGEHQTGGASGNVNSPQWTCQKKAICLSATNNMPIWLWLKQMYQNGALATGTQV